MTTEVLIIADGAVADFLVLARKSWRRCYSSVSLIMIMSNGTALSLIELCTEDLDIYSLIRIVAWIAEVG